MEEKEPHLTQTEARAGSTPRMTRVILIVSMILIVGIFAVLLAVWSR